MSLRRRQQEYKGIIGGLRKWCVSKYGPEWREGGQELELVRVREAMAAMYPARVASPTPPPQPTVFVVWSDEEMEVCDEVCEDRGFDEFIVDLEGGILQGYHAMEIASVEDLALNGIALEDGRPYLQEAWDEDMKTLTTAREPGDLDRLHKLSYIGAGEDEEGLAPGWGPFTLPAYICFRKHCYDDSDPGHHVYWSDAVPLGTEPGSVVTLPDGVVALLLPDWACDSVSPPLPPALPARCDGYGDAWPATPPQLPQLPLASAQ